MGQAKFKYKIGQTVYWTETYSVPYMDKCDLCGGTGKIVNKINDVSMTCPKCKGKGETDSGQGSIKERIASGTVMRINIEIYKEEYEKFHDVTIEYRLFSESAGCYLDKNEYELYPNETDIKINHNSCMGYTK